MSITSETKSHLDGQKLEKWMRSEAGIGHILYDRYPIDLAYPLALRYTARTGI